MHGQQNIKIYRSVAPKFRLFCDKTILKAHSCCGNIKMLAQSRLLLFKLKSAIFFPTGINRILFYRIF